MDLDRELRIARECASDIFWRWKLTFDRYNGFEVDTDGELRVARELFENITSLGASSSID